jgi:hypothetical protein
MLSIEDFLRFDFIAIFLTGDDLPSRAYHSQRPASARQIVEFALRASRLMRGLSDSHECGLPVSAATRTL